MPWNIKWKGIFKGGGKDSLRLYFIVAGTYLVVMVVVFSVLVLRWGGPSLNQPGFEGPGQRSDEQPAVETPSDTEGPEEEKENNSEITLHLEGTADPADRTDEGALTDAPLINGDAEEDPGDMVEELTELPAAANPLPRWELNLPFGHYLSASIPSGGAVHHLSRGVLLRTTPSAPVSALWDGVVTRVVVKDGLYRCSVLIEHTGHIGEYSSFYGNMREVWVKEGALVSRGENIGLMAYDAGREQNIQSPGINGGEQPEYESSIPVSGYNALGGGHSLKIRTVWSGYITDFPKAGLEKDESPLQEYSIPALLPAGEGEGLPPDNPLLYLEIREGINYLDPLNFITVRN